MTATNTCLDFGGFRYGLPLIFSHMLFNPSPMEQKIIFVTILQLDSWDGKIYSFTTCIMGL